MAKAHAAVFGVIAGDEFLLRFRKIKRRAVGLGHACGHEDEEADRLEKEEPAREEAEPAARLRIDDVAERHRVGEHQHRGERHAVRQLVADHLRRRSKRAQERVLAVRAPAGEHDAVHPHRRHGEHPEHGDVHVGDAERNRSIQQSEERRLGAKWHHGKRHERRGRRDDRRQREEHLVGRLRPQVLLHDQLDDVGQRLQQAVQARRASAQSAAECAPRPCARPRPSRLPSSAA